MGINTMRRSIFFAAGVLFTALVIYRLSRPSERAGNQETFAHHLRVNISDGDPPSLHPHLRADIRSRILGKALFEGLTRLKEDGKAELAGAERVEISPSGTRYLFSIRPQHWSDGEPLTAAHFERAWKRAIHPEGLCVRSDLFYIVKNAKRAKLGEVSMDEVGIQALDEKTLVIDLEYPAPYFLDLIAHHLFSPLADDEKEPTHFNGPFIVKNWRHDSVLELEKNPLYWDVEHVKLNQVTLSMVQDPYAQYTLFERGELDAIGDPFDTLPVDFLSSAIQDPRFQVQEISRIFWLYLNTEFFPFQSAKIRRAFSGALDREYLTEHFLIKDRPCHTILPPTLTLINREKDEKDLSSEALRLFEEGLEELGLTRETFPPLTLSYCAYGSQKSLSEVLQERWQKVLGIPISIEAKEWTILSNNLAHGNFQLASCGRGAVYEDPFYFLDIFREKNFSYNFSKWENGRYQELLMHALSTADRVERENYLREAEELLLKEMPVIPIYVDTCKYMTQKRLKGYAVNNSGYIDFKTMDTE
jgi:oligopeptide transport system substrate-binding protein